MGVFSRHPAMALILIALCHCGRAAGPTLDWMLGDWQGIRRDGSDGSEAPMILHVAALRGGPAQVERLEVRVAPTPYVGFAVRSPGERGGTWTMVYANSTRETISRLEGKVDEGRAVWHSVTPGRSRESRVVMERVDENHIERTNSVSEDGGRTWRVLFTDALERRGERDDAVRGEPW